MDQPVASVKATTGPRAARGGAARGQNGSNARARKNGHALKFHNFIANDSWSAATHCLREEHGTKQITVSHWTPSQGGNNNSNSNSSNNNSGNSNNKNQNQNASCSLSSVNQVKQREQSQHPPQATHGLNQQRVSQANKSPGELSLQNNNPCQPFTSGQASQSILESLLAKNILSSQGRPASPYPHPHPHPHAHPHSHLLHPQVSSPSTPKSAGSSHKEDTSRGNNKEQVNNNKVNRRKAFVVRRVVHNNSNSSPTGSSCDALWLKLNCNANLKSKNIINTLPLQVAGCGKTSTGGGGGGKGDRGERGDKVGGGRTGGSSNCKSNCFSVRSASGSCGEESEVVQLAPEQPLDLSIKKQSNGRAVTTVNSSESASKIHSSRQQSSGGMSTQDSVEYLIRSVEQSAAQAASIIARANGSYANSNSSFPSSSSSSSSPCLPLFPPPSGSSNCFTNSNCSSTAHNATVTTIANWVEMNKTKDNEVLNNRQNCSLPFSTTNSLSPSTCSASTSSSPSSSSLAPKSTVRQKLEDAFRQNGFLVKTKQVSDGDATFCKFRQLRKYTRYYLKSWHKHLPDEVSQLYKVSYKNFKGFLPPNSERR